MIRLAVPGGCNRTIEKGGLDAKSISNEFCCCGCRSQRGYAEFCWRSPGTTGCGFGFGVGYGHKDVRVSWVLQARDLVSLELLLLGNDLASRVRRGQKYCIYQLGNACVTSVTGRPLFGSVRFQ